LSSTLDGVSACYQDFLFKVTHVLVGGGAFLFFAVLSGNKHSLPVLKHLKSRLNVRKDVQPIFWNHLKHLPSVKSVAGTHFDFD